MTQRERVLGWCNRIRAQEGMGPLTALPPGVPRVAEKCPVVRAVGATCFTAMNPKPAVAWEEWVGDGKIRYRLLDAPQYVAAWARHFDRGGYPDLVATRP